jgi:hypothetical protein
MTNLPVNEMSAAEFNNNFKPEFLEDRVLSDEALAEIEELFGVGEEYTGLISCDEYHAHDYKCNFYHVPATGVVHRLLKEVRAYKSKLDSLKKKETARFNL